MNENTTQYAVGQVVNGHQLGADGAWHPVTAPTGITPFAPVAEPRNGLGMTGLILGIVGLLCGLVPIAFFVGGPLGVTGAILSIVGLAKVRRGRATNKKTAISGLVVSVLAMVMSVVGFVIVMNAVSDVSKSLDEASASLNSPAAVAPVDPTPIESSPSGPDYTTAEQSFLNTLDAMGIKVPAAKAIQVGHHVSNMDMMPGVAYVKVQLHLNDFKAGEFYGAASAGM